MLFRQIVFYALLVGTISGIVLTVAQFWKVIPIIQSAENIESRLVEVNAQHDPAHKEHQHSTDSWAPADGMERTSFTLLSNVLMAIGLALIMLVAIVINVNSNVKTKLDWRHGLLWGAAGYTIFYLAPSLGVPPEIPGAIAAPLEARQLWWLIAVSCTAAGLAGLSFSRSHWRWSAICFLILPFLIGAPQPPADVITNLPPTVTAELDNLSQQFIGATAIANAAFWLALGLTSIFAARRIKTIVNDNYL